MKVNKKVITTKKVSYKTSSKVLFIEEAGRIYITNSSMDALREAQDAFKGVAEEASLNSEEDVLTLIKEIRQERVRK